MRKRVDSNDSSNDFSHSFSNPTNRNTHSKYTLLASNQKKPFGRETSQQGKISKTILSITDNWRAFNVDLLDQRHPFSSTEHLLHCFRTLCLFNSIRFYRTNCRLRLILYWSYFIQSCYILWGAKPTALHVWYR